MDKLIDSLFNLLSTRSLSECVAPAKELCQHTYRNIIHLETCIKDVEKAAFVFHKIAFMRIDSYSPQIAYYFLGRALNDDPLNLKLIFAHLELIMRGGIRYVENYAQHATGAIYQDTKKLYDKDQIIDFIILSDLLQLKGKVDCYETWFQNVMEDSIGAVMKHPNFSQEQIIEKGRLFNKYITSFVYDNLLLKL